MYLVMSTSHTTEVQVLRHSYKGPDGRLSYMGQGYALLKGQSCASSLDGKLVEVCASPQGKIGDEELALQGKSIYYPGRAIDTGVWFSKGLKKGGLVFPDERLAYHLTENDKKLCERFTREELSDFDMIFDYLLPTMYSDAVSTAQFVTDKITMPSSNNDVSVFGFAHDATVWLLAYAVTCGNRPLVSAPVPVLNGIRFVRKDNSPEMTVSLDYLEQRSFPKIKLPIQELAELVHQYLKP